MESSVYVYSPSSSFSFRGFVSLIVYLFDLSCGKSGVLKSPTVLVFLPMFFFISMSKNLINLADPTFGAYTLIRVDIS